MTVQDAAVSRHAFLFADPAAHSLSPLMHRAAFRYAGLEGDYHAVRVPAADVPAAVAGLRRPDVLGANISLPHKETVLPLLDGLTPAARAIGAVNTIIHHDGRLTGDNTDAPGLHEDLRALGAAADPGAVVVLGAGGAARAAVYTALELMNRDVYIVNRTPGRAADLAAAWPGRPGGPQVQATPAAGVPWAAVSLVVNASSAGLDRPDETPLDAAFLRDLPRHGVVYDMVYSPPDTRVMIDARAAGLRAANGLGMLAQQARLAFRAWTARDVPVHVFREALDAGRNGVKR